ncbi:hypothetical protein BC832DRAFT_483427 [Gaertneriomyces semiglobifer]|nr:hypothetical protein BC832DRAFT_483427 [Gaertneriomyces semiglobifer]
MSFSGLPTPTPAPASASSPLYPPPSSAPASPLAGTFILNAPGDDAPTNSASKSSLSDIKPPTAPTSPHQSAASPTVSQVGASSQLRETSVRNRGPNGSVPGLTLEPAASLSRNNATTEDMFRPRKSGTHLLLYTRAVPLPRRFETITEYRFLMRMTQLLLAGAAFASLATASFNVNYTSAVLAVSGINLMCFTSISSIFVSIGCIIVYCFPAFIGVPPHRHPRFSRVEIGVDAIYVGFWIAAPSVLVWYGKCPRLAFSTQPDELASCLPWNMCTIFGYACAVLFMGTLVMGLRDIKKHGLWSSGRGNGVMWAKGTWAEWADS